MAQRRTSPIIAVPFSDNAPSADVLRRSETMQAYEILHAGYVIAPLVAGLDKFTNRLTNWDQYVAPQVPTRLGISPRTFMKFVGIIEIAAGIGVAFKPKVFGYVVSGWLAGIVGNLAIQRRYYDVALRDVGLSLGALALGRLSQVHEGSLRGSMGRDLVGRSIDKTETQLPRAA